MSDRLVVDSDAAVRFGREHGDVVSLDRNAVHVLDDPSHVWIVVEGEALVFATDGPDADPPRPRQLIATLPEGALVASVDGSGVHRRWILLSITGCALASVPRGTLETTSDGDRDEVDGWVREWLERAGLVEEAGDQGASVSTQLERSHAELGRLELERLDARLAEEGALVDASARAVDLESEQALGRLASVLDRNRKSRGAVGGHDELFEACSIVGHSIGVTIERPHPEDLERAAPIDALAQASKIRSRPVALEDSWWTERGESFVGFRRDGRPVAVMARRKGYDLIDPRVGEATRIDADVAAGLRADGVELIRPLPDGPLTIRSLLRFGGLDSAGDTVRLVLLALVIGLVGLIPPIATSLVFGAIVPQRQSDRLVALAIALVGLAFGALFFQLGRGVALLRIRQRGDHSLQLAIWDRLLRLPATFFRRYQVGDLTERSMVIDSLRFFVTDSVVTTLLAGVFGLFNLVVMFAIDARLAAIGLLVTLAGAAALFAISRAYRRPLTEMLRGRRELTASVHELLTGIVKMRTAGAEPRIFARWANRYAGATRQSYETFRIGDFRVVFEGAFPTAMVLLLFGAVVLIGRDSVTTAAFMGFYVALGQLQTAVVNIARSSVSLLEAKPVLDQAQPILEEAAEAGLAKDHPGTLRGSFSVRQVTFTYAGSTRPIFDGLSVTIEPGEFVAVVGPSGSGKSTLLRLLLGFEAPDAGTVTIDGVDLASLDMEAVRRQIGVVLQQTALLPGTMFENIAGSVPLTMDEAWDAARRAGFDKDVERLPDGMFTNIGDGVGILSGGQRQRLQIARALAGRPRALFLDEATSALDNLTQSVVTRTVEELDMTRIVIAHRLSTIASADRVVVIAGGSVVQDGPFHELSKTPGPFAELISRQQL